jgi:hypothetical protein
MVPPATAGCFRSASLNVRPRRGTERRVSCGETEPLRQRRRRLRRQLVLEVRRGAHFVQEERERVRGGVVPCYDERVKLRCHL